MELTIEQALQQGVTAHKEGKLQDAERLYRAILQSQPAHPDANHNLGVIAVSVDKADAALPLFKVALEANPKIEQFWLSYIDALIKEKQFDNAKKVLEQGKKHGVAGEKLNALEAQLTPTTQVNEAKLAVQNKSQSLSQKRKKLSEQKKQQKAKKQKLKAISPSESEIKSLLEHYQNGQYDDAEKLAKSITQQFPEHQFAWKVLGAVLTQTGRIIESLTAMQKSLQLVPQDAEAHNNLGNILKELGRFDEAEASYTQAIALKPDFALAHSNLGNTLQQLGRLDEAEASYTQAIALKPDYAGAHSNLGNTLKELGRLEEAEASYTQAIALKPDFALAHSNLGNTLKELGRLDEAEASYTQAIALKPDFALAHYNLGITLQELGRLDEAEASYTQAIALKPDYVEAHYNLGITLQELGRLDEALASYTQAIVLKPDLAEAHSNLGVTLQELGRLDEAESCYTQAIALKPDYAEAHNNLGVTLYELGRLDEAEESSKQAIALKPDYAKAHSNLGVTLQELGRLDEAESCYTQAIALKPDFAEAHSNLGITLKELGRLDEALASLRQAIALKPDYAEAHLNLCELLEKMNRVDEISFVIRNASGKTLEKKADFLYYEALTEFRKENYKTAEELVKKININELLEKRQPTAMKLQGDLYHYKKDYSAAFETYKSQNKHVKNSLEYKKQDSEKYFIQQREAVVQMKQLQEESSYKSVIKPRWIQPTFLIGFPRSGTTLLDTILRTHSNIDILEELPMLTKMKASLGYVPTISMIENMDNTAAEIASGFYFEELKKHIEVGKKQIVIDKLPLNILQIPLINQIFPEAKFILALRHPLDCVLSCWMQNFKLNPAMANMVELKRIVDFYDTAMSILKLSMERYSLDIHRIRYEDLVLDFEGNVTNLLTFLGLEWEEGLRNYQKTALAREKINTPSHSQVIKPIYKTASYRWKNYEKYLNPFKRQLEPWLRDYGYLDKL